MTGHTGEILDVKVLDDGRILSWSEDAYAAPVGRPDRRSPGYDGGSHREIRTVKILEDGRILSWSEDRTLRLLDGQTGAPLAGFYDQAIRNDGRIWIHSGDLEDAAAPGPPDRRPLG